MNQDFISMAIPMVMPAAIATGVFVSQFTARKPDGLFGPTGAPSGNYVDVPGLTGIQCVAAPPSATSIQATVVFALEEITASEIHEIILDAYYPQLDAGWRGEDPNGTGEWIASVYWQGEWYSYTILGVGSDSQSQMTIVKVKLATV